MAKAKPAGKTIVCRIERCLGCKSCEIACAMSHSEFSDLSDAIRAGSKPQSRVRVEAVGGYGLPLQCRHCENAPCLMVCPTEAIHRTTEHGPVLIDEERCIGCKLCLAVCPFGVIDATRDGKAVVKCDLCAKRTAEGLDPACVAACPTKALKFVSVDEFTKAVRRRAAGHAVESLAKAQEKAET